MKIKSLKLMTLTVVIPTKNRPADLLLAIKSIIEQKRTPDQIVIIDQSENSDSEDLVNSELTFPEHVELEYLRDTSIKGLVEAKERSLDFAKGDLICFFEDDIILEFEYLDEIEKSFVENDKMLGCSGVITNATSGNWFYRFFYRVCHTGIFEDTRPDIFSELINKKGTVVNSNIINGGLSAWRRTVFEKVKFDKWNKFHMMEDCEFSARANKFYPNSLFINSNARLVHNYSPINRHSKLKATQRKVFEYIVFFKKNNSSAFSYFSLMILLLGIMLQIVFQSMKELNVVYLKAYFQGLYDGINHKLITSASFNDQ